MLIKLESNLLFELPNLFSKLYGHYCRGLSRHLGCYWLILLTTIATSAPAHNQPFRSSNSAACLGNRNVLLVSSSCASNPVYSYPFCILYT